MILKQKEALMTKKLISKHELASLRPRYKDVEIEGLGTVRLRSLSRHDYIAMVKLATSVNTEGAQPGDALYNAHMVCEVYPVLVSQAVVDENGELLFSGPEDEALNLLKPIELAAIGNAAYVFWGFVDQPTLEAEVKN